MDDTSRRQALLAALQQAAKRSLNAEELRQQRVSFVMGMVKANSSTREKVQRTLDAQGGVYSAS